MPERLPTKPPPRVIGPISRTDVVIYQGASGDFEPMHHDEPFAKAAGMAAPIVVGMYPASAMCAWATDWLGPKNVRQVDVRWRAPVWPGDVLTIDGEAAWRDGGDDRDDRNRGRQLEVALTCINQDGKTVVQGVVRFVV